MVIKYMMLNRFITLLAMISIIFFILSGLTGQNSFGEHFIPEEEEIFTQGIDIIYNGPGIAAVRHYEKLYNIESDEFIADLFVAVAYASIMEKYRSTSFDPVFNTKINAAIKKGRKRLLDDGKNAKTLLYLGGAIGTRGVRRAYLGDWKGAFSDAREAHEILHRCIEADPDLYDAYYGLGLYHYYKSIKVNMVQKYFPVMWLLSPIIDLFKNERELGLVQLDDSCNKGLFSERATKHALLRIYLEEEWYDKFFVLADELELIYPNDLIIWWYTGYTYVRIEQWAKALDTYEKIEQEIAGIDFRGIEADVECWYMKALSLYKMGHLEQALIYSTKVREVQTMVNTRLFYFENFIESNTELMEVLNSELSNR